MLISKLFTLLRVINFALQCRKFRCFLILQSGVHKTEIQVQTLTTKHHTGHGVGTLSEPQTMKLLHQGSGAEETSTSLSLSKQVHPLKEKIGPSLRDIGCPMNNHVSFSLFNAITILQPAIQETN